MFILKIPRCLDKDNHNANRSLQMKEKLWALKLKSRQNKEKQPKEWKNWTEEWRDYKEKSSRNITTIIESMIAKIWIWSLNSNIAQKMSISTLY